MPKKQAGENSKKVAGNAKKAEAAAQKQAVDNSKKAAQEDQEWNKGAKSNAKKEDADAKKAAAAAKKAERDALLAAEEATARSAPKNTKTAVKKTNRGLDLSQLDDSNNNNTNNPTTSLNATGIDNALDALALTSSSNNEQVDRHPERRFKAAYAAYEARRLPEIEKEYQGLRKQQRVEIVKKEFEKSEENPFNKVFVAHDAGKEEMREVREAERRKAEERLGGR